MRRTSLHVPRAASPYDGRGHGRGRGCGYGGSEFGGSRSGSDMAVLGNRGGLHVGPTTEVAVVEAITAVAAALLSRLVPPLSRPVLPLWRRPILPLSRRAVTLSLS